MTPAGIWQPRHGHVTQLRYDPLTGGIDGRDDCFEAAYARYRFETALPAGVQIPDDTLIDQVALIARGVPDVPTNADTTLPECERVFQHYGTRYLWTTSFDAALASRYAICLVDGTLLQPAQYPAAWFGSAAGRANHFILWLPNYQGAYNLFDDPLVQDADTHYTLDSLRAAWSGGYLVADELGVIEPEQIITSNCALKLNPNHTCKALVRLTAGQRVLELARSNGWGRVHADAATGWVPLGNMRPAVAA
jgi:hypothetical protein